MYPRLKMSVGGVKKKSEEEGSSSENMRLEREVRKVIYKIIERG